MKLAAILLVPVFWSLAALGQQAPDEHGLITSDLIAWSSMQQPREPEQVRPSSPAAPERASDKGLALNPCSMEGWAQLPPSRAEVFRGRLVRQSDKVELRVSRASAFELANQDQAEQFLGREVDITGTLDGDRNLILIDHIDPCS